MQRVLTVLMAMLVVPGWLLGQTPSSATDVLYEALHIEEVQGDLHAAIAMYQQIPDRFPAARSIAARALLQMGHAYEKLGRPEASAAYERVVRDYADQVDHAAEARGRLAAFANTNEARAAAAQDLALRQLPDLRGPPFSLSPDGNKMAFMGGPGQNVFVHDYVSNRRINVTKLTWDDGWADVAIWSRDGEQIAYQQGDWEAPMPAEIRIATLDGSSRLLYRNEAHGAVPTDWLPDGSAVVGVVQHLDNTYTLGLFPLEGGSFVPLRSLEWDFDYNGSPNASPDGRFIVFEAGPRDATDIHIVGVDGRPGSLKVLTDHPADNVQPRWSPDGKHVVFLSRRYGDLALWGISVENGAAAGEPFLIKNGIGQLLNWTPAGLVYLNRIGFEDVFTMPIDPNTGQAAGPPIQIAYPDTGRNRGGSVWSPDGSRLAFIKQRRYVVVTNADGTDAREFEMPPGGYLMYLRWLPDGSGLSYLSANDREVVTLFRVRLDTGTWESYPFPVAQRRPYEWSRDGGSFYYTTSAGRGRGRQRIIEHELAGGRERVVFSSDDASSPIDDDSGLSGFYRMGISRDFKKLAILVRGNQPNPPSGRDAVPDSVWLLDLETEQVRIVKEQIVGARYNSVSWSPDGRYLVCSLLNSADLEVIAVDDGRSHRITFEPGDLPSVGDGLDTFTPFWSPDGDRLAFQARRRGLPDVWLIEEVIFTPDEERDPSARR